VTENALIHLPNLWALLPTDVMVRISTAVPEDGDQLTKFLGESDTDFQALWVKSSPSRLLILADPLAQHLQSKFLDMEGSLDPFRVFFETLKGRGPELSPVTGGQGGFYSPTQSAGMAARTLI
jgi:hypothetical protein